MEKLYTYRKFGIKLGLKNMRALMNELGNPQNEYKIIHIAGTNGKGSVAAMLESILCENGYNIGKYTSPHILEINERICVNKKNISNEDLEKYFSQVEKAKDRACISPTFFEMITAISLLYFKEKKIDWLLLEVGLGGRYDATNIVDGDISIITSISYDHMDVLGDTLEKIAYEKAGIIKKNKPVFFCEKKENIKKIIMENADIPINIHNNLSDIIIKLSKKDLKTIVEIDNKEYEIPLFGNFQGKNFVIVYNICKYLEIKDEIIKKGLKNINLQGRFEFFERNGIKIILDIAHNEDSIKKLSENIQKIYKKNDVGVIISMLEDKDITKSIKTINECASCVVFTSINNSKRGLSGKELYKKYNKYIENSYYEDEIKKSIDIISKKGKKIIVITGSFYLISKAKKEVNIIEN